MRFWDQLSLEGFWKWGRWCLSSLAPGRTSLSQEAVTLKPGCRRKGAEEGIRGWGCTRCHWPFTPAHPPQAHPAGPADPDEYLPPSQHWLLTYSDSWLRHSGLGPLASVCTGTQAFPSGLWQATPGSQSCVLPLAGVPVPAPDPWTWMLATWPVLWPGQPWPQGRPWKIWAETTGQNGLFT